MKDITNINSNNFLHKENNFFQTIIPKSSVMAEQQFSTENSYSKYEAHKDTFSCGWEGYPEAQHPRMHFSRFQFN